MFYVLLGCVLYSVRLVYFVYFLKVSDCKALQKREKWQEKYAAFRVVIRFEDKDKIFEDNLWPLGVDVRDWIFTNSNQNGS